LKKRVPICEPKKGHGGKPEVGERRGEEEKTGATILREYMTLTERDKS
jgi:hypothetical protein